MEQILLVEDNQHIMAINERYLGGQGYGIVKAYTVKEAKAALAEKTPDLIILDIMLPDGDGVELCQTVRRTMDVPILFLTAKVSDLDVVAGLDRGGDDYLTKPYDLSVLGARVKALLRRTSGGQTLPQNSCFSVGPIELDIVQAQAHVDGVNLNLSRTEFGILLYLAQHQGKTVPREDLLQAVWGITDENAGSMLWTAVSRLKRKTAMYEERFYIDSDHNGYELVIIPANRRRGAGV